jgi:hypothetical protein
LERQNAFRKHEVEMIIDLRDNNPNVFVVINHEIFGCVKGIKGPITMALNAYTSIQLLTEPLPDTTWQMYVNSKSKVVA